MPPTKAGRLGLLHFDSAYTLAEARARGKMHYFFGRDASGLFARTWSVHPVADRAGSKHDRIKVTRIGPGHGLIEGQSALCGLPRWLAPLDFVISQVALYRLLVRLVRSQRLSAIAAVDPFLSGLLGLAVAWATKRPLLVRVSGNADDIYRDSGALAMPGFLPTYGLQKAVTRFVLKRADLVSAINENNLDYALANGARKALLIPISGQISPIHLTDPAKREGTYAAMKSLGLPADRPFLLYFGRLIDLKHPDDALRAMAQVMRERPDIVGMIAGEGDMDLQLKALAKELGIAQSVRFPGVLDQERLSLILPQSITLSTSAGQMAILESALGGAAIVAFDCDFQSEFIKDGRTGFLVARRDWRAMAKSAARIADNPELMKRLSKATRQCAVDYMAPERTRNAEWVAFTEVLAIVRSPGP